MSQRVDQRDPTRKDLDAYNKCLELSDHAMRVCKPKEKNVNAHHIPKRNAGLGRQLMDAVVEMGADILEANDIYVGANIHLEERIENYGERLKLQNHALRMTYRVEHIFKILHFDKPFAESTHKYMMDLLCDTRDILKAWRDSDRRTAKRLE